MVVSSKFEITKFDMKKLLFIFLGIFPILIASCASAQSTPNSIPSTEGIKEELSAVKKEIEIIKQSVEKLKENTGDSTSVVSALATDIDSLKNKLQENTKQNISIEKRLGAVEDNLKEMRSPTENMILQIAKENVNAAKNYHDSIKTLINVFWWIFWVIIGSLTILISSLKLNIPLPREWVGKILDNLVSEPLLRIKEKEKKQTLKSLVHEGLIHYERSLNLSIDLRKVFIGIAIKYTETALDVAKEIFNLEPRYKEEDISLCNIYSNLSYYYSYLETEEEFDKIYRYASASLKFILKYEKEDKDEKLTARWLHWVDNYWFFCKQFFNRISQKDKETASQLFNNYHQLLLSFGVCNERELEEYRNKFL